MKLSETDVVQPDILVVCDTNEILPSHIEGAPDLFHERYLPLESRVPSKPSLRLSRDSGSEVPILALGDALASVYFNNAQST